MRQDQYELKGAVLEAPLEWQGLRLAPGRGGVLVTGLEGTDQRRFQRQLTVLKGYAALAADRRGERPLRLRQEDLPEREGPETLAAVWYGRAAEAEDQHGTLVACYNGFGALPGGFAAVEESLARWAGRPLGGEAAGLCPGGPAGGGGPGREGGALPDPAQLDGPGDGGAAARAAAGAV